MGESEVVEMGRIHFLPCKEPLGRSLDVRASSPFRTGARRWPHTAQASPGTPPGPSGADAEGVPTPLSRISSNF